MNDGRMPWESRIMLWMFRVTTIPWTHFVLAGFALIAAIAFWRADEIQWSAVLVLVVIAFGTNGGLSWYMRRLMTEETMSDQP